MDYNIPSLPLKWSQWSVTGKIGQGSFGEVYKAERIENNIRHFCAIKIISLTDEETEIIQNNKFIENPMEEYSDWANRYVAEIHIMQSLHGESNIVNIIDYYLDDKEDFNWVLFIQMELLTPLSSYQQQSGHDFTEQDIIKLGCDICSALSHCESKGILHRDVKIANIFVSPDNTFKLGDFSEAKKIDGSFRTKRGTEQYMAPEIYCHTGNYDNRADIYSLGIVLYMLSNVRNRGPFLSVSEQILSPKARVEALEKRMSGTFDIPMPSNASPELAQIILKAISYNPDDRYPDAESFRKSLSDLTVQHDKPLNKDPAAGKKEKISALFIPACIIIAGLLLFSILSSNFNSEVRNGTNSNLTWANNESSNTIIAESVLNYGEALSFTIPIIYVGNGNELTYSWTKENEKGETINLTDVSGPSVFIDFADSDERYICQISDNEGNFLTYIMNIIIKKD